MSVKLGGFGQMTPTEIFDRLNAQFEKHYNDSHLQEFFSSLLHMKTRLFSSVDYYQSKCTITECECNDFPKEDERIAFSCIYEKIKNEFNIIEKLAKRQLLKKQNKKILEIYRLMKFEIIQIEYKLKFFNALVQNKAPLSLEQLIVTHKMAFTNYPIAPLDKAKIQKLVVDIERGRFLQLKHVPSSTFQISPCLERNTSLPLSEAGSKTEPRTVSTLVLSN